LIDCYQFGNIIFVRIVGREKIARFQKKHPDSATPLDRWIGIVESASWKTPADVRGTFANADFVGGKVVFNIGGNKYRLIGAMSFEIQIAAVQAVLTHKEYNKGKWK
jgi:mRNA interferase HigB